jgi:hypothetical protein
VVPQPPTTFPAKGEQTLQTGAETSGQITGRVAGVRALFNPRNIAIVGASDRPGNWSQRVYRSLKKFEFPGAIYAVNPRNKTVWDGQTCYPSLSELPEAPDHVVVIVPGAAAVEAIIEAGKAKARAPPCLRRLRRGRRPEGTASRPICARSRARALRCRARTAWAIPLRRRMTIPTTASPARSRPGRHVGQSGAS